MNVFYLCQSLNKIAKHCIKDNANIFILFRQNHINPLESFHECHISGDTPFKEFHKLCICAWKKEYGFLVINLWGKINSERY